MLLASRSLGRGGGSALPGVVAQRVDPGVARDLATQLPLGVITVSGTNGKTTTCRMLAHVLSDFGLLPVRNDSGSNLMRGVASALVQHSGFLGGISRGKSALGLFEVDEAAFPGIAAALSPHTVLLLDLFRDQLDRYGEVATVARLWSEALSRLPSDGTVVVNGDDPLLAVTAESAPGKTLFFGVGSGREGGRPEHASDIKACPRCGGTIEYRRVTLGHLGDYACGRCGLRRPNVAVEATDVILNGVDGSTFRLHHGGTVAQVALPLPGLYNVYNAAAAAATALSLGVDLDRIAQSLGGVTPAFGRMETIAVDGRRILLALAKNPAGLNEVLRAASSNDGVRLLVMLNDNTADGHDVSWIWDADVEMLQARCASVVFSGTRAGDMALRFKYAGVIGPDANADWSIEFDTAQALDRALSQTPCGETLLIVPTYTALLDVRDVLARRGYAKQFWES